MLCALLSTGGLLRKGLGVVSVIERSSRRVAEPSWGRVLATTVKLSVSWRLRAIGFGPGRPLGRLARNPFRLPAGQQHRPIAGRWRLATLLLALALVAAAVLRVTGVFSAATPAVTGVAVPDETGTHPASPLAVARSQAAAWIAAQVSGNSVIACYPDMCAALQAQGVAAG